nr:MAG TPA: hypothetical protein [Caudoviricetes sp.]
MSSASMVASRFMMVFSFSKTIFITIYIID